MKFYLILAFICLFSGTAFACIWDRDTLRHEAEGIPDILETISGRFDRYPDLYYEMRRDRILPLIEKSPQDLALYDDIAVAYDRLGDSDTAIKWMEKKKVQLDLNPDPVHEYRYFANLGTFYAHRWLKTGGDLNDLTDIDTATVLIKKCIELNPEAHFGREKYQLKALKWIQSHSGLDGNSPIVEPDGMVTKTEKGTPPSEAVQGFSGLITLGAAWESVDIFEALAYALQNEGRHHIAWLASLRVNELVKDGKHSLTGNPTEGIHYNLVDDRKPLNTYYKALRAEAQNWQKNRTSFIEQKLKRGEHPDTHPGFWIDYSEKTSPPQPPLKIKKAEVAFGIAWICLVLGVITVLAICVMALKRKLRKQRQ